MMDDDASNPRVPARAWKRAKRLARTRNRVMRAAALRAIDDAKQLVAMVPGRDAFDVATLVAFYEALTGRTPSEDEIAEARRYLDEVRLEIEAAMRRADAH